MLARFRRDCRGASALEFALAAPLLALVLLGMANGWSATVQVLDMRGAVKNGANYVMKGGTDLTATRQAVMSAWIHRPEQGQVTTAYQCVCGDATNACTTLCADGVSYPKKSMIIQASMPIELPYAKGIDPWSVTQSETVRVR